MLIARCQPYQDREDEVAKEAESAGMRLETRWVIAGPRKRNPQKFMLHWWLEDAASGKQLVQWWPSNGKFWVMGDGTRGTTKSTDDFLRMGWEAMQAATRQAG